MQLPGIQQFINIHSHHKPHSPNEFVIRNGYHRLSPTSISSLPYAISVGIHPWHASYVDTAHLANIVSHPKVLAIGEAGLDKITDVPFDHQMKIFMQQIELAVAFDKPIIVHCVRSFAELIRIIANFPAVHFILHDYRGKAEATRQLINNDNVWLSFGKSLLNTASPTSKLIADLPLSKFFLETDNFSGNIMEMYEIVAKIKSSGIEELKGSQLQNFLKTFKIQ